MALSGSPNHIVRRYMSSLETQNVFLPRRNPNARYPKISFRLSAAEKRAIEDAAATAGVTVSDYVRVSLSLASRPRKRRTQARAIQRALQAEGF